MREAERDQELRLRSVELAVRASGDPLPLARQIYAFVTGEADKSPRQVIIEALERADVR